MFDSASLQAAQQQSGNSTGPTPSGQPNGTVYTMPKKFIPKDTSRSTKASGGHKGLWIVIIVLGILITVVVAIAVYALSMASKQPNTVTNTNVQTSTNQPANTTPTTLENSNASTAVVNQSQTVGTTLNVNSAVNSPDTTAAGLNTNTPVIDPATISPNRASAVDALDKDKDSLTDEEEVLYGTTVTLPDTDQDGFVDGKEITAFYSPLKANARLGKSGTVTKYVDQIYGWTMYYPSQWLAEPLSSNGTEVLFTSNAVDGEFVEVLVADNTDTQTAAEWYAGLFDGINATDLEPVTINGLSGIVSPDGFTYYLADNQYIIAINYNFGTRHEIHFRTSFKMMAQTFEYTPPAASTDTSQ